MRARVGTWLSHRAGSMRLGRQRRVRCGGCVELLCCLLRVERVDKKGLRQDASMRTHAKNKMPARARFEGLGA